MNRFYTLVCVLAGLTTLLPTAWAQDRPGRRAREARLIRAQDIQPGIYFPQAPRPCEWRKSIGAVFTTTPPELTEEIRVTVPALDVNVQRGLSKHWFLVGRLQTQILQSNLQLGFRWARPLTDRLYVSAGNDFAGWLGALAIRNVFDSQAYGLLSYPNVSVGYRLTRELQLTAKGEVILDAYYRSRVGTLAVTNRQWRVDGYAFTFMLEQPFYGNRHVSLGLRTAYADFNWQFWSLYSTFNRNLIFPQLIFNFIL